MITSTSGTLLLERREKLLIVKFNIPKKKNALGPETYEEVVKVLNDSAKDDTVNVVALTGIGDFYSSGNDISANSAALAEGIDFDQYAIKKKMMIINFVRAFVHFPKLLVAVVNGPCFGIAATTAALCDIIYCSDKAYFQTPFTKLGLCAEGCSTYTFPRILGTSKASEMLMLDYKLTAQEALKYNFISEIFTVNEIDIKVWPRLSEYSKMAIGAIQTTKKLIKKFSTDKLEEALIAEGDALQNRWYTDEFYNAMTSFMSGKNKSKL